MSFTNLMPQLPQFPLPARGRNRMILLASCAVVFVVAVGGLVLWSRSSILSSKVDAVPKLTDLPGAAVSDAQLRRLAMEDAQNRARLAEQQRQSYLPSMKTAAAVPTTRLPDPVVPAKPAAPAPGYTSNPISTVTPAPASNTQPARQLTPEEKQGDLAYAALIGTLIAGMAPKASAMGIDETPDMIAKKREELKKESDAREASYRTAQGVPATGAGAARSQVLMPALRWSMAQTIVATETGPDGNGGQVIVEMTGGPLNHARLLGTAQRRGDLMGVSLTQLNWQGRTLPVDAVLVSPETRETAVASSVDHHYGARLLYPSLAAVASGAGQAIALSGSSQATSAFGTAGIYKNLNTGEIIGVGVGAAGNNLQQVLNEMAPKGPTVKLDAGVPVGVMFLKDVVDKGEGSMP